MTIDEIAGAIDATTNRSGIDAALSVSCLGPVRTELNGASVSLSPSQVMAVALLVAAGPNGLTADELLTELHNEPPESGKQTAVMLISRLRGKVSKPAITIGGRYAFDPNECVVDVWRFADIVATRPCDAVRMWHEPFAGLVDLPPRLRTESERLRQLYDRALEAAGWQIETGQNEDLLSTLLAILAAEPHNEALTASAAAASYRLGKQTEALELVRRCRETLVDAHGLDPTPVLRMVEDAILSHHDDPLAARFLHGSETSPLAEPDLPGIFGGAAPKLVGREEPRQALLDAISRLSQSAGAMGRVADRAGRAGQAENAVDDAEGQRGELVVVRAEAGAGKTATVASALAGADTSARVRIGFNDEEGAPYGSILHAFPELDADIRTLAIEGDPTTERNSAARRALHLMRAMAAERPLILVLEDAHVADSQTLALLRSITSKPLPGRMLLIITARPTPDDSEWSDVLDAMLTADGQLLELEPLTMDNVEAIVDRDHPDEGQLQREQFARRVYEMSNGNALIASILSRDAPPQLNTILLPETISPEESLGAHLRRLIEDPRLEDLLTSAALIGRQFAVDLLAFVVDQPVDETIADLERAGALGVCEKVGDDVWQFDHLLTVNYFSTRMPLLRPLVFSRIARHPSAPIESLPRYVAGAGDNLSPEFAYGALVKSGRNRRAAFAFPEALATLTHALALFDQVEGDELQLRLDLADCASRSGALEAAIEHRAAAFALAEDADDHDAMSRAALAGLPSGEFAGGEPDRLDMLKKVDATRVTYYSPEFLARYLFRIERITDDTCNPRALLDKVETFLNRATLDRKEKGKSTEHAEDTHQSEDLVAWQSEQLMGLALSYEARPIVTELAELRDEIEPGPLWAEIRHRELVAAITEQTDGAIGETLEQAKLDIHEHGSARIRWSMDVLEAALDLSSTRASKLNVEAARRSGVRWGIPDAHDSWFVQLWVTAYVHGMFAEALAGLDASRDQIADNLAWHSGEALCAANVGDNERARREVDYIIEQLPSRGEGPWAQTVAALLAETAAVLDDPSAAAVAHAALVPHTGRAIVLGVGSAYLGPVDRYLGLAMSVLDPSEATTLYESALAQSLNPDDVWAIKAKDNLTHLQK